MTEAVPPQAPTQPWKALRQEPYFTQLVLGSGLAAFLLLGLLPRHLIDLDPPVHLFLHSGLEIACVVLASIACWLLWQTPSGQTHLGRHTLACALAGAAILDLAHTFSYRGMPPLVTPSGPEKAIAFWLAARVLLALGLSCIAFVPRHRKVSNRARMLLDLVFAGLCGGVLWVVLWHPDRLPSTYVEGHGLTTFKVLIEWTLVGIFALSAWRLRRPVHPRDEVFPRTLALAAMVSALCEVAFSSYSSVTDAMNVLGHLFKVAGYGLLVRGAYQLAVRRPLEQLGDLASALSTIANPTAVCDKDGLVRWVNTAFETVTGRASGELIGQHALNFTVDVPGYGERREMLAALHQGRVWRGLAMGIRADGTQYVDNRSISPMRDSAGALTGYVITGEDITERTRQQHAVADSEQRLRLLLDSAPDAIVVIDERGIVQMVNPQLQTLLGYAADDIVGDNIERLMPMSMAGHHDLYLKQYLETGEQRLMRRGRDLQARRKDGALLHVNVTVGEARVPSGRIFIGFVRDITERIQAQEALRDRETRYRALIETALDGVWVIDHEGRLLVVNEAYARCSGYTVDELVGMHITDLEAALGHAEVRAQLRVLLDQGSTTFETTHQRKDGSIWFVEVSASHAPIGNGVFFAFLRDVTQRKTDEERLRRSEERFELALKAANDGLWDRNLVDGSIYFSPRWKGMLGYGEDELDDVRTTFDSLLHPDDLLRVHLTLSDFSRGLSGDRCELEFRMHHKDGRWIEVLSRAILQRDDAGKPIRLIGTHQDISDRKQAQQAVRDNEEKLRNLFELSPLGIALTAMDGKMLECNRAFARLTGFSTEELKRMSYWDLTPHEYLPSELEQLAALARQKEYGPYEKEYRRKDGSRVPVRLNGVQLEIDGRPHIWSIIEDLTHSRQLEAERQQMQQQQMQSQKLEALGYLTGGIAHDFNNMLAAILGLASLGLERHVPDGNSKLARYLREIVRTSERGRDLVAKMLAYARTEVGEDAEPRDIAPLVSELHQMLSSSIPAGVRIAYEVEEPLPAVRIKAVDLHQVVMNLVINACDAVQNRGTVRIRVSPRAVADEACVTCHDRIHGDHVALEVMDDGPGIPPALVKKIFDPFFTTKEVGKGTGLGLSSVQGIVHKVGGHLRVESHPGHTVITVLFPAETLTAVAPAESVAHADRSDIAASGAEVWIVDDDSAVLIYLSELLVEHGLRVQTFSNPAVALQAFHSAQPRPDLLITDQTMPDVSGEELARAVLQAQPGFPVILCTGYSDHIDEHGALTMGVRRFLRKPFDPHQLLDAVAACCEPRKGGRANLASGFPDTTFSDT
jgi:PAS domain S-box-containing protein